MTGNEGTGIVVDGSGASLENVSVTNGTGTAVSVSGANATVSDVLTITKEKVLL